MNKFLTVLLLASSILLFMACPPFLDDDPLPTASPPPQGYTITYDANGGTGDVPVDPKVYRALDSVPVAGRGTLVMEGNAFVGWNTAADGSGEDHAPGTTLTMPAARVTLYAQWTAGSTYSVYYLAPDMTAGELPVDANAYAPGSSLLVLPAGDLARDGYVFGGWTLSSDGQGTVYSPNQLYDQIDSDLFFHARWLPDGTTMNSVTYDANGGTGNPPVDPTAYAYAMTVTVMANPGLTREDHSFAGWNTAADPSYSSRHYDPDDTFTMSYSDVTLYAEWDFIPFYTISYDIGTASGQAPTDSTHYHTGDIATLASADGLSLEGHKFMGWFTNPEFTGIAYQPGDEYAIASANRIFYARWLPLHQVYFDGNGNDSGTVPTEDGSYAQGEFLFLPWGSGLAKSGFDFLGWNSAADGSGNHWAPGSRMVMGEGDALLYAEWQSNRYRYVAAGQGGLRIFDCIDPTDPVLVGIHVFRYNSTLYSANDVCVRGTTAYVATGTSGLSILDVSNPADPQVINSIYLGGDAKAVAVDAGYAFVLKRIVGTSFTGIGMAVVDLSAPDVVWNDLLGTWHYSSITVSGGLAYIACNGKDAYARLLIADISDPGNQEPSIISQVNMTGPVYDIDLHGIMGYAACDTSGIGAIDLSDPYNPGIPSYTDTSGKAHGIAAREGFVFLADDAGGLKAFAVGPDGSLSFLSGVQEGLSSCQGLRLSGGYCYAADDENGLRVLDASNPSAGMAVVGSYDTQARLGRVAIAGNYLYAIEDFSSDDLLVYDISPVDGPIRLASVDLGDHAPKAVAHDAGKLYVGLGLYGTAVYDLMDPGLPVLEATLADIDAYDIAIRDGFMYTLASDTLEIYEIATATRTSLAISDSTKSIFLSGNYAYIAGGSAGLTIVDISNPLAPAIVSTIYSLSGTSQDVVASGNYAYVAVSTSAGTYGKLDVIDISDPANPLRAGSETNYEGSNYTLSLQGSYLYVCGDHHIITYSLAVPDEPAEGSTYLSPYPYWGLKKSSVSGGRAFFPTWGGGVLVMDISSLDYPTPLFVEGEYQEFD